ncbi:hypothetical protein [Chryseobacterium lineare]
MEDFINTLGSIFSKTGDSTLKNCSYQNGKINIQIELFDDELLNMEFLTEFLYRKNIDMKAPFNKGYLKCIKLSEVLNIENNHYTVSGDFITIMKTQKSKLNLALGLSANKYTHIITYSNNEIVLAFVVNDKDSYKYEYE